jgi:hypothetical protein
MSDPKLQRADGCSIFATLIITGIVVFAFYFIQGFFEQDKPAPVSEDTTKQRLQLIELHLSETEKFNSMIESSHTDNNSSLESVMRQVIQEDYDSNKSTTP